MWDRRTSVTTVGTHSGDVRKREKEKSGKLEPQQDRGHSQRQRDWQERGQVLERHRVTVKTGTPRQKPERQRD